MLNIFTDFHWPTFFTALVLFILVLSAWNVIKTQYFKAQTRGRAEKADKKLKEMQEKLAAEDKKIEDLLKKLKPASK